MNNKLFPRFLALSALSLSATVFAGGNHAGGHSHDHEDSAIGKPGVAAKASRSITVEMTDNMRFTPSDIKVKQGETVRFVVKKIGRAHV